jgi:hypothetical protein
MSSFRYGFGFVPNYRVALLGTGGSGPAFPSSGNVGYYTPFDVANLGFSSGNNVNLVVDQSGVGNDLTQSSPSSNMVLIEDAIKPWNSRLSSDGSNDNYDGLPTQAGDFTYVFKCEFNIIAQTEYLLSDTGDSALLLLSDNYLYLRDATGANDIALTGHTIEAGDHVYIISREGDDLKYYVDSCFKQIVDVTGHTFTFSRVGSTADSLQALNAEWGVWNRAFTQADVDYFSYLRSEDTNAILLPPLTPGCPTPPSNALPSNLPTIL